jgi:hypothetical protein
MRFVGHVTETIHRIYQRLRAEDVSARVPALRIPSNENWDFQPGQSVFHRRQRPKSKTVARIAETYQAQRFNPRASSLALTICDLVAP